MANFHLEAEFQRPLSFGAFGSGLVVLRAPCETLYPMCLVVFQKYLQHDLARLVVVRHFEAEGSYHVAVPSAHVALTDVTIAFTMLCISADALR